MPRPSLSLWFPRALRGCRPGQPFRPQLLPLESRETPARTWIGPAGGLWSVAANWQENAIPGPGEDLIFNTTATGAVETVNDLPGKTSVNSVQFTGGSFRITGSGGSLALTGGGVTSDADATKGTVTNVIDLPVAFTTSQSVLAKRTGNQIAFGGTAPVTLGNITLTFDAAAGSNIVVGDGLAGTFSDGMNGTGSVVKIGDGILKYAAANSYTGATTVLGGTLDLASPSVSVAAPSIAGPLVIGDGDKAVAAKVTYAAPDQIENNIAVVVNADGQFLLNGRADAIGSLTVTGGTADLGGGFLSVGDGSLVNAVTLNGATVTGLGAGSGTLQLNADLTSVANADTTSTIGVKLDFANGTRRFNVNDGKVETDLLLAQGITNATGWVKDKAGAVEIQGQSVFNGTTSIADGTLVLNVPTPFGAVQSLPPDVFLGDGAGPSGKIGKSAVLRTNRPLQLSGVSLKIGADGFFDPNNNAQAINGLSGTGFVSIGTGTAAPDLTVGTGNLGGNYTGSINGEGRFVKVGTGVLTLTGDSKFDNAGRDGLVVAGGTLVFDGKLSGAGNGVQVGDAAQPGGTVAVLGGSGTVGAVRVVGNANVGGASVNPGTAPDKTGILATSGIDLKANTLTFDIAGTKAGTGHDQITTPSTPTFTSNTILDVRVNPLFVPAGGQSFVLIDNGSGDPVNSRLSYLQFDAKTKQFLTIPLPEGASFPDASGLGFTFFITYQGGADGKDVVITEGSAPTATITRVQVDGTPQPDPIQNNWFSVLYKVEFSAFVTNFDPANIQFSGTAALANVTARLALAPTSNNPVFYVSLFSPEPFEGTAGIIIPAGSVTSPAGVPGQLGVTPPDQIYTVDTVPPTVTIAPVTGTGFTNGGAVDFVGTFSEKVTGFTQADLLLSGSTTLISNTVFSSDGKTFTFTVNRAGVDGTFRLSVPGDSAFDIADNGNGPSNLLVGGFDQVGPAATITLLPP
ncbi:MAG: beta strand repeat-containing protein, partial [Fimbriiglobus sp.]